MLSRLFINGFAAVSLAFLAACGGEEILPGERFAVLTSAETGAEITQLSLGAPVVNADWTHINGNVRHAIQHPELNWPLEPIWSVEIGAGNSGDSRIIGSPVIAGGIVYTMDAASRVSAFATRGAALWSVELVPAGERGREGFGGGLALDGGRLLVTTGFGEVLALLPANGAVVWRQRLSAVVRAAPAAADGMVYVVARDDVAYGIVAETGRLKWSLPGAKGVAGLLGGASPAVAGSTVVLPFASGQLIGLEGRNGGPIWGDALSGGRRGFVRMQIGDISGDPVISGGQVYSASQGGELAATDVETGERLWTLGEGAYGPVWPAGDSVFLVSDEQQLLRVRASDGAIVWRVSLPGYAKPERRKHLTANYGPVLAGGRLIVASGDGVIRSFDPTSGAALSETAIPGGAAAQPAVAGGVLYVVSASGTLHAFQ